MCWSVVSVHANTNPLHHIICTQRTSVSHLELPMWPQEDHCEMVNKTSTENTLVCRISTASTLTSISCIIFGLAQCTSISCIMFALALTSMLYATGRTMHADSIHTSVSPNWQLALSSAVPRMVTVAGCRGWSPLGERTQQRRGSAL